MCETIAGTDSARAIRVVCMCIAPSLTVLCLALPARAATVDATAGLTFTAATGETNDLAVTATDGSAVVFTDTGATVGARAGCQAVSTHSVSCSVPIGSTPSLRIDL